MLKSHLILVWKPPEIGTDKGVPMVLIPVIVQILTTL